MCKLHPLVQLRWVFNKDLDLFIRLRPRNHGIQLTVLLKVSGVSAIEFKMGGTELRQKSRSFKTRTSGTAVQRHAPDNRLFIPFIFNTWLFVFHSNFQQDVLIFSPVLLKVSFKHCPRHALLIGWWAYTSSGCELHYKQRREWFFIHWRCQSQSLAKWKSKEFHIGKIGE